MIQHENCTNPRWFSAFFSYRVNSFLNLLCHEFVLSTTHLLGEYFLCEDIAVVVCSYSLSSFTTFFFLCGICNTYPRLINSCSSGSELYALSRHRCCCSLPRFPLPALFLDGDDGLLI